MTDPERKKRLEEIKMRKARLKKMINIDQKKKEESDTTGKRKSPF